MPVLNNQGGKKVEAFEASFSRNRKLLACYHIAEEEVVEEEEDIDDEGE